jgi:hypothetical protein
MRGQLIGRPNLALNVGSLRCRNLERATLENSLGVAGLPTLAAGFAFSLGGPLPGGVATSDKSLLLPMGDLASGCDPKHLKLMAPCFCRDRHGINEVSRIAAAPARNGKRVHASSTCAHLPGVRPDEEKGFDFDVRPARVDSPAFSPRRRHHSFVVGPGPVL